MARTWPCSRSRCRTRRAARCRSADNQVNFRVSGQGKVDRRGQRRSHQPRIRQGQLAQSLLRPVHGAGAVHARRRATSRWRRASPGLTPASVDDLLEGREAAAPGAGLGARGPGGLGHHGPVEDCAGGGSRGLRRRFRRRRQPDLHFPAEREFAHRNRRGRRWPRRFRRRWRRDARRRSRTEKWMAPTSPSPPPASPTRER